VRCFFLFIPEVPLTGCIRNRLCGQVGYPPLLNGARVDFNTALQPRKKTTATELDRFDNTKKSSPWCDIELETSEAMADVLETAPDQSAWWKDTRNRLPEPWWRFLYLLFHRDPGLDGLRAEHDGIIQRFRHYILLMTHDPIRKHGTRALALIERKPKIVKLFMVMDAYSPVIQMQFKGLYSLHLVMYGRHGGHGV
jgi:hypothetical protein